MRSGNYQPEFVAHVLAPDGEGFAPVAWSPLAATVHAVDDRDAIRADYEANVDLQEAVVPLGPVTDAARLGWLLAFGDAPPAEATAVDDLKEGRELRFVVRRRIDPGAGTLTLRLLR